MKTCLAFAAAGIGLALLAFVALRTGRVNPEGGMPVLRGLGAFLGLGDGLPRPWQDICELRLVRLAAALGVGGALALAGGLLQGLFRNPLASPGVLGVSAGAGLGASAAVLVLGGYGPELARAAATSVPSLLVPLGAFAGALGATGCVWLLAARAGGSLAALLLCGVAVSALCGGLAAGLHGLVLDDFEVSAAIVSWGFGSLEDRSAGQCALLGLCLALACAALPFLARELDLFALGEDDARALGVSPRRVKALAVCLAALLTGTSVAVAGQIVFVGLMVPNLCRVVVGPRHARLLPLSALAGAILLLGVDLVQRSFFASFELRPGVFLSLVGAPFFLVLLTRRRSRLLSW